MFQKGGKSCKKPRFGDERCFGMRAARSRGAAGCRYPAESAIAFLAAWGWKTLPPAGKEKKEKTPNNWGKRSRVRA